MESRFRVIEKEIKTLCNFDPHGPVGSKAHVCLLYDFPPTTTYIFKTDGNGNLKSTLGPKREDDVKRKVGYSGENNLKCHYILQYLIIKI